MLTTFKSATDISLREIQEEKDVRKTSELFLMFAMGSQYDHLIVQRLEKLGVFCLVADPSSVTASDVRAVNPTGIILSGGPASAHTNAPQFDQEIFKLGIPVLGICLGFQMGAQFLGGSSVETGKKAEFGVHTLTLNQDALSHSFLDGISAESKVLQSHRDKVLPGGSLSTWGSTDNAPVSIGACENLIGVQFHPEVTETEYGERFFENFCFKVCGAKDSYPAEEIAKRKVREIREKVGDKQVLLALSGGCDSSTVAYLLKEAFKNEPGRVKGVYIKGIDRPDDERFVLEYFSNQPWLELEIVDRTDAFLEVLKGKTSMKEKRRAMFVVYEDTLNERARAFDKGKGVYLAQGTLYTDISESGHGYDSGAAKAKIKEHHNVNRKFDFPLLEPLDDCVKDGGRNIGRAIGVPEVLVTRHPFPGPGLVVRIEGLITRETLAMARQADDIYIEELRAWGLYDLVWQAGAVVTQSVHTMSAGDDSGEGVVIMLWAVWSVNGFTAQAADLLMDFLKRVDQRIGNEVPGVAATSYRLSGKPKATIEVG